MLDKTIKVYVKSNYGTDHIYIKNEKMAQTIELLTGQKTISQIHIMALRRLGFDFKPITLQKI